jgi:hypothetical protein
LVLAPNSTSQDVNVNEAKEKVYSFIDSILTKQKIKEVLKLKKKINGANYLIVM